MEDPAFRLMDEVEAMIRAGDPRGVEVVTMYLLDDDSYFQEWGSFSVPALLDSDPDEHRDLVGGFLRSEAGRAEAEDGLAAAFFDGKVSLDYVRSFNHFKHIFMQRGEDGTEQWSFPDDSLSQIVDLLSKMPEWKHRFGGS